MTNGKPKEPQFTPQDEAVAKKYGALAGLVVGIIWRRSQSRGYSYASHANMAEVTGMGVSTFIRWLDRMTQEGYVEDITPNVVGTVHYYRVTGKGSLEPNPNLCQSGRGISTVTGGYVRATGVTSVRVTEGVCQSDRLRDNKETNIKERSKETSIETGELTLSPPNNPTTKKPVTCPYCGGLAYEVGGELLCRACIQEKGNKLSRMLKRGE